MAGNEMAVEDRLVRSTVRLVTKLQNGRSGSGTGFFYKMHSYSMAKIFIVTNKHVVAGAVSVEFALSTAYSLDDMNEARRLPGQREVTFSLELTPELLFEHPALNVDLCMIDITIPFGYSLSTAKVRAMCLDDSWLPREATRIPYLDIHPVLVIGYPAGLWDQFNNMPIARRGVTATHPQALYEGRREFLVDVAAFPGSSGSPVFSYESPMYRADSGNLAVGTRASLLGVIARVWTENSRGRLEKVEVPTIHVDIPVLATSLNLAIALHADELAAFRPLVFPPAG